MDTRACIDDVLKKLVISDDTSATGASSALSGLDKLNMNNNVSTPSEGSTLPSEPKYFSQLFRQPVPIMNLPPWGPGPGDTP